MQAGAAAWQDCGRLPAATLSAKLQDGNLPDTTVQRFALLRKLTGEARKKALKHALAQVTRQGEEALALVAQEAAVQKAARALAAQATACALAAQEVATRAALALAAQEAAARAAMLCWTTVTYSGCSSGGRELTLRSEDPARYTNVVRSAGSAIARQ